MTHFSNFQLQIIQLDEDRGEFVLHATFDHPYPTTKIMWIPDQTAQLPDLVATSGDYLRLWRVTESQVRQECMLNNVSQLEINITINTITATFSLSLSVHLSLTHSLSLSLSLSPHPTSLCLSPKNKNSEFCAPLTSFDWNETDPNLLGASSIDTTCTIWGLEVRQYSMTTRLHVCPCMCVYVYIHYMHGLDHALLLSYSVFIM